MPVLIDNTIHGLRCLAPEPRSIIPELPSGEHAVLPSKGKVDNILPVPAEPTTRPGKHRTVLRKKIRRKTVEAGKPRLGKVLINVMHCHGRGKRGNGKDCGDLRGIVITGTHRVVNKVRLVVLALRLWELFEAGTHHNNIGLQTLKELTNRVNKHTTGVPTEGRARRGISLLEDILPEQVGRIGGNYMNVPLTGHTGKVIVGVGTHPGELTASITEDHVNLRTRVRPPHQVQSYRRVPAPAEQDCYLLVS